MCVHLTFILHKFNLKTKEMQMKKLRMFENANSKRKERNLQKRKWEKINSNFVNMRKEYDNLDPEWKVLFST